MPEVQLISDYRMNLQACKHSFCPPEKEFKSAMPFDSVYFSRRWFFGKGREDILVKVSRGSASFQTVAGCSYRIITEGIIFSGSILDLQATNGSIKNMMKNIANAY